MYVFENNKGYVDIPIYETVFQQEYQKEIHQLISDNKKIYVTFTSASTVEGFIQCSQGVDLTNIIGICIGEQTAKMAEKYNINHYISTTATIDSMIDKLMEVDYEEII